MFPGGWTIWMTSWRRSKRWLMQKTRTERTAYGIQQEALMGWPRPSWSLESRAACVDGGVAWAGGLTMCPLNQEQEVKGLPRWRGRKERLSLITWPGVSGKETVACEAGLRSTDQGRRPLGDPGCHPESGYTTTSGTPPSRWLLYCVFRYHFHCNLLYHASSLCSISAIGYF